MKTIELNQNEIRAIDAYLSSNPCKRGCAYDEMRNSRKDCEECELESARISILEKLGLLSNSIKKGML
ncbi:hypothetical protein C4071_00640 [Clostridioides difficile]|uniref:hypothetical protein n=2 Tax=Clostridioides difficile TaxID=1496 RepID=UPI00038DA2F8|nr:hypothetical protein [Clostridioides difficile]EGT4117231.1 hypothetical protein [Clostridioides difficile]EQH27349.1 hypothetical protein QM1_0957 [Clostridioides difficile DA00212]MCJ0133319.1 hypothetical protein [Clostridioides difficile]MCJ0174344.1 hypothetical protein [Clostridioides difficile]MCU5788892.1 hypothetical protein [Clostridioides difficile]